MKIQNNIEIEDLELDIVSQYSYEITFTKKFKELFKNPIERKFAVEEILEFLLDNKMIAIDEEFLLLIEGILPFYSRVAQLNYEKFIFYTYWNKEKNYISLIFDKFENDTSFNFFNINQEENYLMKKILH